MTDVITKIKLTISILDEFPGELAPNFSLLRRTEESIVNPCKFC